MSVSGARQLRFQRPRTSTTSSQRYTACWSSVSFHLQMFRSGEREAQKLRSVYSKPLRSAAATLALSYAMAVSIGHGATVTAIRAPLRRGPFVYHWSKTELSGVG